MATDPNLLLLTFPICSAFAYATDRWPQLSLVAESAPRSVRDMIGAPRTAAFLRGLAQAAGLPVERVPRIAWAVLQIAIAEKTLVQLPSMLSTSLGLANDKAQQMAGEIEKELFAPIMVEYSRFVQSRKNQPNRSMGGATNVLNLKNQPASRPPTRPASSLPRPQLPRPPQTPKPGQPSRFL